VNFFTTTSYTYYKIRKLRFKLSGSLQKFDHSKITQRLADEFFLISKYCNMQMTDGRTTI